MRTGPRSRRSQPVPARSDGATSGGAESAHLKQGAAGERRSSGRARAAALGSLIILVGLGASIFLAGEWRSSAQESNRKAFDSTAADINNTLDSKLDERISLTQTMRAIATLEPKASETHFMHWYEELQRGTSTPLDVTAELIQPIPASGLAAFRRRAKADPTFRALLGGKFRILPPGRRAVYCLITAIVGNHQALSLAPGLQDYCAPTSSAGGRSPFAALIYNARDTGAFFVIHVAGLGSSSLVAIGAAVYREGAPIATVAERRAATSGSIGTTFDSGALVRSALGAHRSLTLALYHQNIGGPVQLIDRVAPKHAPGSRSFTKQLDLGEGWSVRDAGTSDNPIAANTQGLVALIVGALITLLIFLVYRVLSGSRRRAWGLVGEKTGELAYRALHDPLTDLPNRSLVIDRAEQILARARRLDVAVTALFVDIDGFKQINDRFGHRAGDEVLRQVGARLKTVLRENDTVGRLGGDEFVMLVDSIGLNASPELVAERILDVLRQPIELLPPAQSPIMVTASIGVATGLPVSADALMQDADLALYKAKALGKNGYALFESAMQTAAKDRMHLELDLAEALDANQFFLVYQPMLDLENERVVGVEALLRWRHPTNGVIAPDVFIPIAEDNGSIVPIGGWVLEQACAQAARWHEKGYVLNISVNVSARQLERPEFVEEVRTALANSTLDPATLTLEITETVLMRKPDATAHLLGELKGLGVRIAVDDFGTGYSSLAYLRQFPVDSLKIDRTFITGLALSSEAHALAHTLIQLGKALGLQTLAEGVEQHNQVRELQREGCDLAQGFLFARPLAPDALERFLEDSPGLTGGLAEATLPSAS
jgi:diguanylate cyclase (GGDEF)-like protein